MDALTNWENYLHDKEKDSLVQLAILKAQFELIHPFRDGNGRVGRMLVPLILFYKNKLSSPMFYISSYLDKNRQTYFNRLLAVSRNNDWDGWISFFLKAIEEQAKENSQKAIAVNDLYRKMRVEIPEILRSPYSTQVIDAIFSKPTFNSSYITEYARSNRMATNRILDKLVAKNILIVITEGKARRPTIYTFKELLDIIR